MHYGGLEDCFAFWLDGHLSAGPPFSSSEAGGQEQEDDVRAYLGSLGSTTTAAIAMPGDGGGGGLATPGLSDMLESVSPFLLSQGQGYEPAGAGAAG